MSNLSYNMPTPRSPFVMQDGTISPIWYLFLSALFQTVGGPSVVAGGGVPPIDNTKQFEEYPVTNLEAIEALRGVDELRNVVASMGNDGNAMRGVYDELNNALAGIRALSDLRNRIELLEDRLA